MRLGNIFIYTQLICLAFQNLVDILTGLKQLLTLKKLMKFFCTYLVEPAYIRKYKYITILMALARKFTYKKWYTNYCQYHIFDINILVPINSRDSL